MPKRVAYSTGFWCTNIGNGFFSLGVEYVLKKILGDTNVTIVSDYQTYTTGYGRRLFPNKNQLEYLTFLDVDYLVLAGPVISKYFLNLWREIILKLEKRGVRYIILSAGMMKMTDVAISECQKFFKEHPPYAFVTRERKTIDYFGRYADHSYDGICFSFFAPEYYHLASMCKKYIVLNFDKIPEPQIWLDNNNETAVPFSDGFLHIEHAGVLSKISTKTDRFSDAFVYMTSVFPQKKRNEKISDYDVIRTDHRFHPHYRKKIYAQSNSFCADLPYGYLNLYGNAELTLSDRVHACAVTMAYGHSAMLFSETNRVGLLDRVGAEEISMHPVALDMERLSNEKKKMLEWLNNVINQ